MSDFLSSLIARSTGEPEVVTPRTPAMFEGDGAAVPPTEDEIIEDPMPDTEPVAAEPVLPPMPAEPVTAPMPEPVLAEPTDEPPAETAQIPEPEQTAEPTPQLAPVPETPALPLEVESADVDDEPQAAVVDTPEPAPPVDPTPLQPAPPVDALAETPAPALEPVPEDINADMSEPVDKTNVTAPPAQMAAPTPPRPRPMAPPVRPETDTIAPLTRLVQKMIIPNRRDQGPAVEDLTPPPQAVADGPAAPPTRLTRPATPEPLKPVPEPIVFDVPANPAPVEATLPEDAADQPQASARTRTQSMPLAPAPMPTVADIAPSPEQPRETVVNVSIGRVEVRINSGDAAPAATPPSRDPAVMSLDDYLAERAGGGA